MKNERKSLPAQIIEAIKNDDLVILRSLLTDNPDQISWNTFFAGQTWLGYAAWLGKINTMKLLVELGADVNLGDHRENVKPICAAANKDQKESVEFLLENGAILDTETSVQNPLFAAVVGRSPRIVNLLLEAGIDCTVRYNSSTMKNMDAVSFALMRGEKECAQIITNKIAKGNEANVISLLNEAYEIAELNAYGKKA